MSSIPNNTNPLTHLGNEPESKQPSSRFALMSTSFLFSILQSACSAIVAINGVRLAIGLSSLATTVGVGAAIEHFHQITWLRILLMIGALGGSLITLVIPIRSRYLRHRPSARWRYEPLSQRQRRMEAIQIAVSLLTLVLIAVEEYLHFGLLHTL